MSGIEGAGEIIGGGLAGRAAEHELATEGKGGDDHDRPDACLNCGTPLQGDYCHTCGQKGHVHRTLHGLWHDIVHGVLHLDGKIWRTLPLLVWKPGKLTRDYIDGHRARYISPIAFYLFTVVAMFALVVSVGDEIDLRANADEIETVEQAEARLAELDESISELEEQDFPGVSGTIAGVKAQRSAVRRRMAELGGSEPDPGAESEDDPGPNIRITQAGDQYGGTWLEGVAAGFDKATANPALFLYKVQTTSYKLSWLLIPLSLPFMWLLFPFSKRFTLYDHAVFVTYSISFMMLMVVAVGLLAKLDLLLGIGIAGAGTAIAFLYAPFHIYRQLKGTYNLSRMSALLRTIALAIMAWVVLGIFIAIMLALGALG